MTKQYETQTINVIIRKHLILKRSLHCLDPITFNYGDIIKQIMTYPSGYSDNMALSLASGTFMISHYCIKNHF